MKSLNLRVRKSQKQKLRLVDIDLVLVKPAEGYQTYDISTEYPADILNWLKVPMDYSYVESPLFPNSSNYTYNSFIPIDYYIPYYSIENLSHRSYAGHIASILINNEHIQNSFVVERSYPNNSFMLHNELYLIILNDKEFSFTSLDPDFKKGIIRIDFKPKTEYTELMSLIPDEHRDLNLSLYRPKIYNEFMNRFSELDKSHLVNLMIRTDNFTKGEITVKFDQIELIERTIKIEFFVPSPGDTISEQTIWNRMLNSTIFKEYSFTKLNTADKVINIRNRLSKLYESAKQEMEANFDLFSLNRSTLREYNNDIDVTYINEHNSEINVNYRIADTRPDWPGSTVTPIKEEFVSQPYSLFEKFILNILPPLSFVVENNDKEYKEFCRNTITLYLYYLYMVNCLPSNNSYDYTDGFNNIIIPSRSLGRSSRTSLDFPGLERLKFCKFLVKIPERIAVTILTSVPDPIKNSYIYKIVDNNKPVKNTTNPSLYKDLTPQEVANMFEKHLSKGDLNYITNENKV